VRPCFCSSSIAQQERYGRGRIRRTNKRRVVVSARQRLDNFALQISWFLYQLETKIIWKKSLREVSQDDKFLWIAFRYSDQMTFRENRQIVVSVRRNYGHARRAYVFKFLATYGTPLYYPVQGSEDHIGTDDVRYGLAHQTCLSLLKAAGYTPLSLAGRPT
jgi:hypothetical protein